MAMSTEQQRDCPYCGPPDPAQKILFRNELVLFLQDERYQGALKHSGVIIPIAHRLSPFDFTTEEWEATHELLLGAKAAQDERLAPDGYVLIWNCFSEPGQSPHHAHLHVIPRFDDEPLAERGGRSAIKAPENRRPDPSQRGNGRAQAFGPTAR